MPEIKFIETSDQYRDVCLELIRIVGEEAHTKRENAEIAELCTSAARLGEHAKGHALEMLQQAGSLRPTFVLFSKAGDGIVAPIVISEMPDDLSSQISIITPIVATLGLAPIDGYAFISEMWGAVTVGASHIRLADSQSRMSLVLVRACVGLDSCHKCYTIVRHPETERIMSLRPLPNPVVAHNDNPCLSNLYEMVEQMYNSLSVADIAMLKAHIFGTEPPSDD